MPVDETILDNKIDTMRTVVATKRKDYKDAQNILDSLQSIQMVTDPNDETKKIKPDDRRTREIVSTARRNELYDKQIPKADALIR